MYQHTAMEHAGSALLGSAAGALTGGCAPVSLHCRRSCMRLTHVYRIIYMLPVEGYVHKVTCSSVRRCPSLPWQPTPVPSSALGAQGCMNQTWVHLLLPPCAGVRLSLQESAELPTGLLITKPGMSPWCWDLIWAVVINVSEKWKPQVRYHLQVALMEGSFSST